MPKAAPVTRSETKVPKEDEKPNAKTARTVQTAESATMPVVSDTKNRFADTDFAAWAVRMRSSTCEASVTAAEPTKEKYGMTARLPTKLTTAMNALIFRRRFCSPAAMSRYVKSEERKKKKKTNATIRSASEASYQEGPVTRYSGFAMNAMTGFAATAKNRATPAQKKKRME